MTSTEEDKDASDDQIIKESSQQAQQRLRQLFQEKEKDGLAADISLRRKTNERLYLAVEAYWSSLSKFASSLWNVRVYGNLDELFLQAK